MGLLQQAHLQLLLPPFERSLIIDESDRGESPAPGFLIRAEHHRKLREQQQHSFHVAADSMSMVGTAMDENEARMRLQAGGFLIALDVPPGLQLGIDCKIYQVRHHDV
jgi:hypothetical protein